MKIISGKYAKRSISIIGNTRPPLFRIRKNIFDLLGDITGMTILDLCAGSGSLGIESLSLGADFVYFFEENKDTALNLMNTLKNLDITNAKVSICNVEYLPRAKVKADIIFFDPPFGHSYVEKVCKRLVSKEWVHDCTQLLVRTNYKQTEVEGWRMWKLRKIGSSFVHFYIRNPNNITILH